MVNIEDLVFGSDAERTANDTAMGRLEGILELKDLAKLTHEDRSRGGFSEVIRAKTTRTARVPTGGPKAKPGSNARGVFQAGHTVSNRATSMGWVSSKRAYSAAIAEQAWRDRKNAEVEHQRLRDAARVINYFSREANKVKQARMTRAERGEAVAQLIFG
jgi:hypothetical protein